MCIAGYCLNFNFNDVQPIADIRDVLEEACCRESRDGEPLPCTITVVSTDGDDRIVVDIESW